MFRAFFIILLLSLNACLPSFKAGADFDPKVDFSKYKTFKQDITLFVKRSNPLLNSQTTKTIINTSIKEELENKGLQFTNQNPDLIFSHQTLVQNKKELVTTNRNPYPRNSWAWARHNYWNGNTRTYTRNYEESTIVIDLKDAQTRELVWQGWIKGKLVYDEELWQKYLSEQIKKAMSNFPPQNTN